MADKSPLMRQCCLTREEKPVAELLRFALSPDNDLVPDVDGKAPGRGAWVTLSEVAVNEAIAKKAFSRSLKQSVNVPDDLAQLARRRLEERFLGALGMARKAGVLVTGGMKVRSAIEADDIVALLTASDAAVDGRRKIFGALYARYGEFGVPHFEMLSSDQMGLALGLENVIHAALIKGAAADSAVMRAKRLHQYCANGRKEDTAI